MKQDFITNYQLGKALENIKIPKFNEVGLVEERFTGNTSQDIIITDAIFFQSFSDGTTMINGVNLSKNQPYIKPLLLTGTYEPFTFNDKGNEVRITIYYKK